MLAFLLSKGNFQKQAYHDLIWQVESSFEYNRYTIEKGKRDTLMRDFSSLAEERKRLECEVHELQSIRESNKILQEELEELKKQKMDITRRLHQSERIFPYFEQLVEKRPFFIITSDVEIFEGTPFENNVVDKKIFLDDRKKKDIEVYQDKVLFFTRSSFHSREWGRLKNFLDNNTLKYVEIGHFDLASYLEDIMRNIYLEENEYGYHI